MVKYNDFYIKMIDENKDLFDRFMNIHDLYTLDPEKNKHEFNLVGKKILDVIRIYERKLCGHSEKGQYAKYSSSLSDKFWALIRQDFPKIDFVGVI